MRDIYLRGVPEGLARALKAAAAIEGKTLRDYLVEKLRSVVLQDGFSPGEDTESPAKKRAKRTADHSG